MKVQFSFSFPPDTILITTNSGWTTTVTWDFLYAIQIEIHGLQLRNSSCAYSVLQGNFKKMSLLRDDFKVAKTLPNEPMFRSIWLLTIKQRQLGHNVNSKGINIMIRISGEHNLALAPEANGTRAYPEWSTKSVRSQRTVWANVASSYSQYLNPGKRVGHLTSLAAVLRLQANVHRWQQSPTVHFLSFDSGDLPRGMRGKVLR